MKKKRIALVLAAIIALSMALTACSTGDKGTGAASSAPPETTDDGGRKMEGNLYLEGLPIVKEQETFTMFCDDNGLPEDKIMYPILQEQTNVKVELMLFPNEAANEKKNILLNSGDYPDVMGGWIFTDKEIMKDGMKEQVYIPLNDMIAKYSPKMTEILELPGIRNMMTLPDGEIYTIPYVIEEPIVSFTPYINVEWLKKLNLKMPTTPDELYEVLKAFKTDDPNGNGKADEIPFSSDPINRDLGSYAGWWGANASYSGVNKYFSMVDGKLEFGPSKDAYKQMIKFFAKLNTDKLLDPEFFTHDTAAWKAKGKGDPETGANEKYGVSMAYGAGDFAEADKTMYPDVSRTHYDALPVLQGDPAIKPIWRSNGTGVTTFRTQVVITDNAKNPATIIRWWDNVFQLENSVQIQAGLIGKRILKTGEGEYESIPENDISKDDKETYGWGNMFTQSMPKYIPRGFKVKDTVPVYKEKEIVDAMYKPFLDEAPPLAWVAEDAVKRISVIETDAKNYIEKKEAEWISGQKDVDAEWDAFLKELETIGVPELTKLRNDAIANIGK